MNRQQKIAMTIFVVSLLGIFLGITMTLMKHYVPDFPKGTVAFGGFILSIGMFLIISRILKKKKGEVVSDERDKQIEKNAYLAGFGAVYLLVILVSYLPIGIAPEAKNTNAMVSFSVSDSCALPMSCDVNINSHSVRPGTKRRKIMSKLQKSAWFNLGLITISSLFALLCFTVAAGRIEKGFNYVNVILFLLMACFIIPAIYIIAQKKSYEAGFDEREKMINQRATTLSLSGLMIVLYLACFIPFVALGGGNIIKVVYLPVIFICTILATQLIKSIAIIIQCVLEQENGQ
jgi:hypothetical protein